MDLLIASYEVFHHGTTISFLQSHPPLIMYRILIVNIHKLSPPPACTLNESMACVIDIPGLSASSTMAF